MNEFDYSADAPQPNLYPQKTKCLCHVIKAEDIVTASYFCASWFGHFKAGLYEKQYLSTVSILSTVCGSLQAPSLENQQEYHWCRKLKI